MAGLYFAYGVEPGWALRKRDNAISRMLHYPWLRARTFEQGEFAMALVLPEDVEPPLWHRTQDGGFVAVFGEYYPEDRQVTDACREAERIAACAVGGQLGALRNQNGLYNLVCWDDRQQCLTLANDSTGSLLLFRQRRREGIVWASEPGLLSPGGDVHCEALASLLFKGFCGDDSTPDASITVLPPATTEQCIRSGQSLLLTTDQGMISEQSPAFADAYGQTLREAVSLRAKGDTPLALPLTAGLDSRILLAELLAVLPGSVALSRIQSFTLRAGQQRDPEVAAMLARAAGIAHQTLTLPMNAIKGNRSLLEAALGTTADWHPATHLAICGSEHRGRELWLGFLGGTLSGARVHPDSDIAGLAAMQRDDGSAFGWRPSSREADQWQQRARASALAVRGASPVPELVVNLWGRQRRYTSYLVRLAWNFAQPVCPFVDRRLLNLAVHAPRECLARQSARRRWFVRAHPEFAAVPGNDGHPISGSVGSRLRSFLRSAGIGRLLRRRRKHFVRGYETDIFSEAAFELWAMLPDEREFAGLPPLAKLALGPSLLLGPDGLAQAARDVVRKEQQRHAGVH